VLGGRRAASSEDQEVTVKAKSAIVAPIVALGALALMANEASAQHRAKSAPHLQHALRAFGQSYGSVPAQAPRIPSAQNVYESYSGGSQRYPNPDRDPYGENARNGVP
jgi:hypothetical protein